jgi:hypothetical protein
MTSVISGNNLVMTNNFGSFTFNLGTSSGYIVHTSPGDNAYNPELVVVGDVNGHQAAFNSGTSGQVQSFMMLSSGGGWQKPATETLLSMSCLTACTQTGETSVNLSWSVSGNIATFAYKKGATSQGVSFWD